MSATYKGNPTNYSSATAWAASQVRALGALCTPSTPNGLVFICTTGGTTAAAEPAWNTAPYPTIGTSFTDGGGVVWACYGSQPGQFPPILQLPVDTDPPVSAVISVTPFQTTADQLAWLLVNAGLLASANVWTSTNRFDNITSFYDFCNFYDYTATGPAMKGFAIPQASGTQAKLLIEEWPVGVVSFGNTVYGRIYADNYPSIGCAWMLTINASWGASGWSYDDSHYNATKYIFGSNGISFTVFENGGSSPWSDSAWTTQLYFPTDVTTGFLGLFNGALTVDINGQLAMVGGITTTNAGTTLALAVGSKTNIGTVQTLISAYPVQTTGNMYRVDVNWATLPTADNANPTITVTYTDYGTGYPVTCILGAVEVAVGTDTQSPNPAYYGTASMNLLPANATDITVTIAAHGGGPSLVYANAAITMIA